MCVCVCRLDCETSRCALVPRQASGKDGKDVIYEVKWKDSRRVSFASSTPALFGEASLR